MSPHPRPYLSAGNHRRGAIGSEPGDDGTNIGDAIVVGLEALLVASPKKKVLVLLTDGNNEPAVPQPADPEGRPMLARDLGVTMHTIAIGRIGKGTQGIDPGMRLPVPVDAAGPISRFWSTWPDVHGRTLVRGDRCGCTGRGFPDNRCSRKKPRSRTDPHPLQ